MKISCCGLLNALACSLDESYCAGAIGEKIYIWQVKRLCMYVCLYCIAGKFGWQLNLAVWQSASQLPN